MSLTIISVDTGNKNIKTPNTQPFNSGLICHGTSAPPLSVETLRYDGKYYSLTEKRIPTMFDKTETEDFYILTLLPLRKRLRRRTARSRHTGKTSALPWACRPPICRS